LLLRENNAFFNQGEDYEECSAMNNYSFSLQVVYSNSKTIGYILNFSVLIQVYWRINGDLKKHLKNRFNKMWSNN